MIDRKNYRRGIQYLQLSDLRSWVQIEPGRPSRIACSVTVDGEERWLKFNCEGRVPWFNEIAAPRWRLDAQYAAVARAEAELPIFIRLLSERIPIATPHYPLKNPLQVLRKRDSRQFDLEELIAATTA